MIEKVYNVKREKLIPPGTILNFHGGYHADSSNGTFTMALAAGNTINDVNNYFSGFWKVADGTAPNDSGSPIFNASNKYLPNITDDRFLRGGTSSGGIGGIDSWNLNTLNYSHTHSSLYRGQAEISARSACNLWSRAPVSRASYTANASGAINKKFTNAYSFSGGYAIYGSSGAATVSFSSYSVDNKPKYIGCFNIIKIK